MRLEILNRDNWTCQTCLKTDKTLHVHHFYYKKGMQPWEYPPDALVTICADCHTIEHMKNLTPAEKEIWEYAVMMFNPEMIRGISDILIKHKTQ